jgi:hypothetical protein
MMLAVVLASVLAAACTGSACPNPCRECAWQPVDGENPSLAAWRTLFVEMAQRRGASDLPAIDPIEVGPDRERQEAAFPCHLLPAIAMTESSIAQFCSNGLTVISFDCGFGVMQVTSGAADYPGIEARADINVAAGADILASKWNGDGSYGGRFGDSDPVFLESWYFAVWAYNGFIYRNNPNNPDFPASRPPFNSPGSLSRGSYPYQELVWGYLGYPQSKNGEAFQTGVDVTYPTDIPDQSGLFSVDLPLPEPAHADPCTEECPPWGCPPSDRRTLLLDDADAGFSITGAATWHGDGGFRDGFRSAPPARPASVEARWVGVAPATGVFDVAGFVPLDPANNEGVVVTVLARGEASRFVLDQGTTGGNFSPLGAVKLREGTRVVVVVDNDAEDPDATHAVGFDAFRLSWRGDGNVAVGGVCATSIECAGTALCVDGVCTAGCDDVGCGVDAVCDVDRGICTPRSGSDEGEGEPAGEGEGEGEPPRLFARSVVDGCGCAGNEGAHGAALATALVGVWSMGRRRRRRVGSTTSRPAVRGGGGEHGN